MKTAIIVAAIAATVSASIAQANQLGVLSSVSVGDPQDGISETSLVTPMEMVTNLPEGFDDDLTILFFPGFDPHGTRRDMAFVIPTFLAGLSVSCTNYAVEYSVQTSFARCVMYRDFVETITEPVTLTFRFLGGGGTSDDVGEATWTINPFVAPELPLNVAEIQVREPAPNSGSFRVVFTLNRPAEDTQGVRVGLFPRSCFAPATSNGPPARSVRDPVNLFEDISFAAGQIRQVLLVTSQTCNSEYFVIRTWMGTEEGVENFADPQTSAEREVAFVTDD